MERRKRKEKIIKF